MNDYTMTHHGNVFLFFNILYSHHWHQLVWWRWYHQWPVNFFLNRTNNLMEDIVNDPQCLSFIITESSIFTGLFSRLV